VHKIEAVGSQRKNTVCLVFLENGMSSSRNRTASIGDDGHEHPEVFVSQIILGADVLGSADGLELFTCYQATIEWAEPKPSRLH
jgi:hypothetical protein